MQIIYTHSPLITPLCNSAVLFAKSLVTRTPLCFNQDVPSARAYQVRLECHLVYLDELLIALSELRR